MNLQPIFIRHKQMCILPEQTRAQGVSLILRCDKHKIKILLHTHFSLHSVASPLTILLLITFLLLPLTVPTQCSLLPPDLIFHWRLFSSASSSACTMVVLLFPSCSPSLSPANPPPFLPPRYSFPFPNGPTTNQFPVGYLRSPTATLASACSLISLYGVMASHDEARNVRTAVGQVNCSVPAAPVPLFIPVVKTIARP